MTRESLDGTDYADKDRGKKESCFPSLSLLATASCQSMLVDDELPKKGQQSSPAQLNPKTTMTVCSRYFQDGSVSSDKDPNTRRSFPLILMDLMHSEAGDAVTWLPDGKAFTITDRSAFTSEVLPRYFRQSQLESFVRKLKRWGFKRIHKGANRGAFYHSLFQKDKPHLCKDIACERNGTKSRRTSKATSCKDKYTNGNDHTSTTEALDGREQIGGSDITPVVANENRSSAEDDVRLAQLVASDALDLLCQKMGHHTMARGNQVYKHYFLQAEHSVNTWDRFENAARPEKIETVTRPTNQSLVSMGLWDLCSQKEIDQSTYEISQSNSQISLKSLPLQSSRCDKKISTNRLLWYSTLTELSRSNLLALKDNKDFSEPPISSVHPNALMVQTGETASILSERLYDVIVSEKCAMSSLHRHSLTTPNPDSVMQQQLDRRLSFIPNLTSSDTAQYYA